MTDDLVDKLLQRHEHMHTRRLTWETHWQEVAELVLPRQDEFYDVQRTPGDKRTDRIIDGLPPMALERFASAVEGVTMPRRSTWHTLMPTDDRLADNLEVRRYLDKVNALLFKYRYSPKANFASQTHETLMSVGAFGTGALFVRDVPGQGPRYKSVHIADIYIMENSVGQIDLVHRKYKLTKRQVQDVFGRVPEKIAACKDETEEHEFLHVVEPNPEYNPNRSDNEAMAYRSYDIYKDGREVMAKGGFTSFPYMVSRYVTSPREIYGRSPAMAVLPDIKMANEMKRTILRAAHRQTDPPLLLHDDGRLGKFSVKPNSLNFGALDAQGRQMVKPMDVGSNPGLGAELLEQVHKNINDAFLVTLFQILVETPEMTATEALIRSQEKGVLLSPTMGRIENEFTGPLIEREIDILNKNGFLPPLPEALQGQLEFEVEYTSPLSRQQRAESALGADRLMQKAIEIAGIDPSVFDKINIDEYMDVQADAFAAPGRILRSDEEVAALREAKEQQQNLMALAEQAPKVAGAVKDLADAGAVER